MTDKIFLLSVDEYEKYKNNIPHINTWWWLRSPGYYSNYATYVYSNGNVYRNGLSVLNLFAIRPALITSNLKVGERIVKYGCTWIGIDDDLAIAEVPIGFEMFDEKDNDYETSYIREWLLDWIREREKMTKKEICLSHDTIAYYSALGGIEIKHIEHGIDDYVYAVSGAWCQDKSYHKVKIHYENDDTYFMISGLKVPFSECVRC